MTAAFATTMAVAAGVTTTAMVTTMAMVTTTATAGVNRTPLAIRGRARLRAVPNRETEALIRYAKIPFLQ